MPGHCCGPDSSAFTELSGSLPMATSPDAGPTFPEKPPLTREVGDLAMRQTWNAVLKAQLMVLHPHPIPTPREQVVWTLGMAFPRESMSQVVMTQPLGSWDLVSSSVWCRGLAIPSGLINSHASPTAGCCKWVKQVRGRGGGGASGGGALQ